MKTITDTFKEQQQDNRRNRPYLKYGWVVTCDKCNQEFYPNSKRRLETTLQEPCLCEREFKSNHPLHTTWKMMNYRCSSPTYHQFDDYGGRGISVCERWANDFWAFVEDMGERPEGHTIDRIDNDGNYEPSNCRWATRSEQNKNRRIKTEKQ